MSSVSYKQVAVRCPFYKYDDGKGRITCEGIVDDSSIALIYKHKCAYEMQVGIFCCEHFEKCEIYRMLMEAKYEDT